MILFSEDVPDKYIASKTIQKTAIKYIFTYTNVEDCSKQYQVGLVTMNQKEKLVVKDSGYKFQSERSDRAGEIIKCRKYRMVM